MLLFLAVISFAQNVPAYVPTNGLVGWWPFNGNANDESGNGNNGTVNGATLTTDRFGNVGKAFTFSGLTDVITVNNNNSINFQTTNSATFSFWIATDTIQTFRTPIIQKQSGSGVSQVGYNIGIDNNGNTINNLVSLSVNNGNASQLGYATSNSYPSTFFRNWNHFIIAYNQGDGICYVNGVLDSLWTSQVGNIGDNINPLLFGSANNLSSSSKKFYGKLDDIGIWNRALTQQEITDLYNGNICYQNITVTDTLLINTNITGYNPLTYENTIRIWPNPTYDHITIDAGNLNTMSGYSIRIVNALGQQMFQSAINQQQFYLDLSSWTGNGIYYINIINPQGVTIDTRKIVLQ